MQFKSTLSPKLIYVFSIADQAHASCLKVGETTYPATTELCLTFPEGKTWQDYVRDTRLEITCGEAPFLTHRMKSCYALCYAKLPAMLAHNGEEKKGNIIVIVCR